MDSLVLAPTADPHVFLAPDGKRLSPPSGWGCLPPGDAAVTKRVKQLGPSWAVLEKKGRKLFSKGLWAPLANIAAARSALDGERSTPEYAKRRASDVARRARNEADYGAEFQAAVGAFLRFSQRWQELARWMATAIAAHATPVGSGTVARTKRIPVNERAEAATIAWMRHQTTAYDTLDIPRIKGKRREVRRALAEVSRLVLDLHRKDAAHPTSACPLCTAAESADPELT